MNRSTLYYAFWTLVVLGFSILILAGCAETRFLIECAGQRNNLSCQ